MKRECVECGTSFEAQTTGALCSDQCVKTRSNRQARVKRARSRKTNPCVQCGKLFVVTKARLKSCSDRCAAARDKEIRRLEHERNADSYARRDRDYKKRNGDKVRADQREWHARNPGKKHGYYLKHKDAAAPVAREWRALNLEHVKIQSKIWDANNRDKRKEYDEREKQARREERSALRAIIALESGGQVKEKTKQSECSAKWRRNNPEKQKECKRRWDVENKEKVNARRKILRAQQRAALLAIKQLETQGIGALVP